MRARAPRSIPLRVDSAVRSAQNSSIFRAVRVTIPIVVMALFATPIVACDRGGTDSARAPAFAATGIPMGAPFATGASFDAPPPSSAHAKPKLPHLPHPTPHPTAPSPDPEEEDEEPEESADAGAIHL